MIQISKALRIILFVVFLTTGTCFSGISLPSTAMARDGLPKKRNHSKPAAASEDRRDNSSTEVEPATNHDDVISPDRQFNFTGEGTSETSADVRDQLKFKVDTESTQKPSREDLAGTAAEDASFKTYLGYPKHKLGVEFAPQLFSAKWSFAGQDFNFSSTVLGYGVHYDFVMTPTFNVGLRWSHASVAVGASSIGTSFSIRESEKSYDGLLALGENCFVGETSYLRKYCLGFVVGKDSYPILEFSGDTSHLVMGKVDDIVIGPRLAFESPVSAQTSFRIDLAYSLGTGVGNSGALTSKSNSNLYASLSGIWELDDRNGLSIAFDYSSRTAALAGTVGNNSFSWETKSSALGGRLGYARTF